MFTTDGALESNDFVKIDQCGQISAPWLCDNKRAPVDIFFAVSEIKIHFNVKPGIFGARFKLAIQEVPAGYANQASQIIEEARIAGVYPELPPLTAVMGEAKHGEGEMRGQRELVPVKNPKSPKMMKNQKMPNVGVGAVGRPIAKRPMPKRIPIRNMFTVCIYSKPNSDCNDC